MQRLAGGKRKAHAYAFTCVYVCSNTNTGLSCVRIHTEVCIQFANAYAARDTHVDGRGTQITGVERDNIEGRCLHDIRA